MFRRRTVLALMVVGVIPSFVLVNSVVSAARARREAIAVEWARRGDVDLTRGRAAEAADDYRTADDYAGNRGAYRLQLAAALVAADRPAEAAAQLQTLWSEAPGDGLVNLQLARIAARQQRPADAVRYYHAAIDGSWNTSDPVSERRGARLELARLLLSRGNSAGAQAELGALAADPPPNPADQITIASLLIQAGADNRALSLLASTLRAFPDSGRAAALAGSIDARIGNYAEARTYLQLARRTGDLDAAGAALLDTVTRVLDLDPGARRISSRERIRRIVRAFEVASAALDRCDADALADLRDERDRLARRVTERALARDPDAADETMAFAGTALEAVRTACGEGGPDERALALVLQRRGTP